MLTRRIALWAAFLALAAVIGVILCRPPAVVSFSPSKPFTAIAPEPPAGWTVRDTPLGPTELAAGEAAHTLNFDAYFCKTYERDGMEVTVYAAYWTPGRLDPSLVDGHIPDVCWVGAGGSIVESDERRVVPGPGGQSSLPARFRVFEFPRNREEVVFWHCVGGKAVWLEDQKASPLFGRLRRFGQILRITGFGLSPQEQVFVRISTNRTLRELLMSDLWPAFASFLGRSGLLEPVDAKGRQGREAPPR